MDLGCGSGQATADVSKFCSQVMGIDPSESQLSNAASGPNIRYQEGTAEATGLHTAQYSLLTCAQAMHWCDPLRFYDESARLLKPSMHPRVSPQEGQDRHARGGVLAVWGYDMASIHPASNLASEATEQERARAIHDLKASLYAHTLGPAYWDHNRFKLDRHMRDPGLAPHGEAMDAGEAARLGLESVDGAALAVSAGLPLAGEGGYFHRVARWDGSMEAEWDLLQLEGYLRSWSGYTTYMKKNGVATGSTLDPVSTLISQARALYPDRDGPHIRLTMRWNIFMLLAERTDKPYVSACSTPF